jgi:LysR family hydrogen peroxide-inducible transcriptional activator
MTIVQLEYFISVVSLGSFTEAARQCLTTRTSLVAQIDNLEEELGAALLDRTANPITPTEAGRSLMEQAKSTVEKFDSMKKDMNRISGNTNGRLRIGIAPSVSYYMVPRFIPEFSQKYPDVKVEIREMVPDDVVCALNRERIDVGILAAAEPPQNLSVTRLFIDKIYVYVSPKNELYKRDMVFQKDLERNKAHLIFPAEGLSLHDETHPMAEFLKKTDAQYNFPVASIETLIRAVDASSYITLIPGMAIDYIPMEKQRQIKVFAHAKAYRTIIMATGRAPNKEKLITAVRETILSAAMPYDF